VLDQIRLVVAGVLRIDGGWCLVQLMPGQPLLRLERVLEAVEKIGVVKRVSDRVCGLLVNIVEEKASSTTAVSHIPFPA